MIPALYVGGEPRHGVVRLARELAAALGEHHAACEALPAAGPVHLHFTDKLFGDGPEPAAARVTAIGGRLTVTLHDVPTAADRAARHAAYRAVIARADAIAVNSAHERALLAEAGLLDGVADPQVIPLPLPAVAAPDPALERALAAGPPVLALLGFVYPGKGHPEAIRAAAALPAAGRPAVRALGAVSDGHADDLVALEQLARAHGIDFAATGWLADAALAAHARAAAVPLAAHAHLSASGSINAWIALGRRPLVLDGRYAREIDALRPGTITRYAPDGLPAALRDALAAPRTTYLTAGQDTRPHLADTAAAYRAWWER